MSIRLGDEYAKEAEENLVKAFRASRRDGRYYFAYATLLLLAWIGAEHYYDIPDGLLISATIGIAALCLVSALNARTAAIEADLLYIAGAIEWFGQKRLDQPAGITGELNRGPI
jgi:hypothetical protein